MHASGTCCQPLHTREEGAHWQAAMHSSALAITLSSPAVSTLPSWLNCPLGGEHCPWLSLARVCRGVRWWCGLPVHACTRSAASSRPPNCCPRRLHLQALTCEPPCTACTTYTFMLLAHNCPLTWVPPSGCGKAAAGCPSAADPCCFAYFIVAGSRLSTAYLAYKLRHQKACMHAAHMLSVLHSEGAASHLMF